MPRQINPRALRRRLRDLQAEEACQQIYLTRAKRRAERRVETRLLATPNYGQLRRAVTNADVQTIIDDLELKVTNAERSAVGLPPLKTLFENQAPIEFGVTHPSEDPIR